MKSLLFALGLALCCFVQADQDQRFENFDHSKMEGVWIAGGLVTNCQKLKDMAQHMKAFYVSFKQQSADQLQMTMDMAMRDGCKKMEPMLKRENGVFTTTCGKGGKKTMEFIEMKENSIFTSITISHKKGQCTAASLAVKRPEDLQGAMEGFREFADRAGLEDENILTLSRDGMCPSST